MCSAPFPHAEVIGGPDCDRSMALTPGRHLVGRSESCDWQLADPAVEPVHAVLTVACDGSAVITQLAGRAPIVADGRAIRRDETAVAVTGSIELGDSRIELSDRPTCALPAGGRVLLGTVTGWRRGQASACVVVDLARSDREVLAISVDRPSGGAPVAHGVVRSVIAQLARDPHATAWRLHVRWGGAVDAGWPAPTSQRTIVVTDRTSDVPLGGGPVTIIAVIDRGALRSSAGTSLLQLGPRWRACWTVDGSDPLDTVRLHVRGRRADVSPRRVAIDVR